MVEQLEYGVSVQEIPTKFPVRSIATSRFLVVGMAEWGPIDVPRLVTDFDNSFARLFGGLIEQSQGPHAIRSLFMAADPAGAEGYYVRVAGDAAAQASVTLKDGLNTTDVCKIKGKWKGALGNGLKITVTKGAVEPDSTFNLFVDLRSERKESYFGLSMVQAESRYAANQVNNSSDLIIFEDLLSGITDARPKEQTDTALTGGADDYSVTMARHVGDPSAKTGLYSAGDIDDILLVSIPGCTDTDATGDFIAWSKERGFNVPFLDSIFGGTNEDQRDYRRNFDAQAVLSWPWVKATDPLRKIVGDRRAGS